MTLLIESPYYQGNKEIIMLARRQGEYNRQIVGGLIDLRIEDFAPKHGNYVNIVAPLPPVGSQAGRFLIASMNTVEHTNVTLDIARRYLSQGHTLLPGANETRNPWWKGHPWWEYSIVFDAQGQYIKAPLVPRPGEPDAETIDEMLDHYEVNQGQLKVRSPLYLKKAAKTSDYASQVRDLSLA